MSSAADPLLGRLDALAKLAIRMAGAVAKVRGGSDDWQADSRDLLAGILLADPSGSPARELLEHYRIPVGLVLRRERVSPPSAEELMAALEEIPADMVPPFDTRATAVIDRISEITVTPPQTLVSLRELFGALLESLDSADVLYHELLARGADPAVLVRAYPNYPTGLATYGDFLRSNFPYQPRQVELPSYQADEPPRPGPVGLPDLVGIKAEVDAFAYLIASRQLTPPIAVGLFGDWGSGKSYFLRSLQRRIDQVGQDSTASGAPFYSNIVQIEFNAWQYVGGELWAGLLEHLFRNLRRSGQDSEDLVKQRQQFWVRMVEGASAELAKAEIERQELVAQRDAARQEVDDRREHRERELARLERERRENPLAGWRPSATVRKQVADAAAAAGIKEVGESAEELGQALNEAQDVLRGASELIAPLRARGPKYLVAVGFLILLPIAVAAILSAVNPAPLAAITTTVASVLAALAGYVKVGTSAVSFATNKIQEAQAELDKASADTRAELDKSVREAEQSLVDAQEKVDAAVRAERDLAAKADKASAELAATTPGRVLSDFIADRLASEDYRRHLGVPAIVRRDLDQLSQLMAAQRNVYEVPEDYAIDRIVLYIDDLDRCPTDLVIKVLEAVHLLLAFPLFVVVVAVDSRWLTKSLETHYSQLAGQGATPENYLEKIFQVPFWVLPLGTEARQQIVRGLLMPSVAGRRPPGDTETRVSSSGLRTADIPEFRKLVESFASTDRDDQAWRAATGLTITADELLTIETVADLVGNTPRAVKRFVNIYLLAKSIGVNRGFRLPPNGQLALLLAISVSGAAARIFSELTKTPLPNNTLGAVLSGIPLPLSFKTWVDMHPDCRNLDMSGLADWVHLISRFRFSGG